MEERSILVGLRVAFIFDFEIICLHKGVAIFSLLSLSKKSVFLQEGGWRRKCKMRKNVNSLDFAVGKEHEREKKREKSEKKDKSVVTTGGSLMALACGLSAFAVGRSTKRNFFVA